MVTQAAPAAEQARQARRLRGLASVALARVASTPHRLFAAALIALVAYILAGTAWPLYWLAAFLPSTLADRAIFKAVGARCEAGAATKGPPRWLVAWVFLQSAYGMMLAPIMWFAPYAPGETLAVTFLCAGAAAAAGTLRLSPPLATAGLLPPVLMLLALPAAEYLGSGASNPLLLTPMAGALLLLSFGASLWRNLLASDAAQARAEEAAKRESQSAAAAAAAKTDMIQRMNDELRTPMLALVGAAEHLRRAAATPEARRHIATLAQAGEVLKLVLDDLSDLDRLENGALSVLPSPTDPREIARGVVSAFQAAAQDKHLELFLDVGETPPLVEIDARRVRQVLFNLLANAVRYTTHGGVRVSVGVRDGETPGTVRLHYVVADTGAGMSRVQLARVFGRERLCSDGEGPGLGLAISLRLARLMGGSIHAKSAPEQGSVFTLNLQAPVIAADRTAA